MYFLWLRFLCPRLHIPQSNLRIWSLIYRLNIEKNHRRLSPNQMKNTAYLNQRHIFFSDRKQALPLYFWQADSLFRLYHGKRSKKKLIIVWVSPIAVFDPLFSVLSMGEYVYVPQPDSFFVSFAPANLDEFNWSTYHQLK